MMIDGKNPNSGKRIDAKSIEYLCFEGGGGKGAAYLGVIKALEEQLNSFPIIDYVSTPVPSERQIKGISGASAGAITAFMLATGMSSRDVAYELKRYAQTELGHQSIFSPYAQEIRKPTMKKVGIFETFFETMKLNVLNKYRVVQKGKRERTYVKDKPWWVNFADGIANSFLISKKLKKESFIVKKIFDTPVTERSSSSDGDVYLHSLFAYRGMFSGISVRQYFKDLLEQRVKERVKYVDNKYKSQVKRNGLEITFEDFFNYFGCDLVITGTNVSQHIPKYFSVYTTPSFPVIDAVCISMNLPVIFKPVYIDYAVNKYKGDKDSEYNKKYAGLWVDGGMLNNYPIHAFDKFEKFQYRDTNGGFDFLADCGEHLSYEVAANSVASDVDINEKVLGFRLTDFDEKKEITEDKIFSQSDYFSLFPYLGDILATFMYSGGEGQIRSKKEYNRTILVNSHELEVVDFSPLRQKFSFGEGNPTNIDIKIPKEHRIIEAYESVKKIIT